jgi:hypothetical protein
VCIAVEDKARTITGRANTQENKRTNKKKKGGIMVKDIRTQDRI